MAHKRTKWFEMAQMVQNSSKRIKLVQNGSNWLKMAINGSLWLEIVQIGLIWLMAFDSSKWFKMDQIGSKLLIIA